jgi:hypothetical protein
MDNGSGILIRPIIFYILVKWLIVIFVKYK